MNQADPKVKLSPLDNLLKVVNKDLSKITIENFFPGVEECRGVGSSIKEAVDNIYNELSTKQRNRYEEETEMIKIPSS